MKDQVYRRLTNAMRQLRQEIAASGEKMQDCEFIVSVRDGKIEISDGKPSPLTPLPQGEGNKKRRSKED